MSIDPSSPGPEALRRVLSQHSLNEMQQAALPLVRDGRRNLLIAAPTGSGKTLLAELALVENAQHGRLGVYLVPMKAIAVEKRADWDRLAQVGLRIYKTTGDDDAFDQQQAEASHVVLATPEKWDLAVRHGLRPALAAKLGLVVVDEVHMIGDEGRGAGLEALLTRLRLRFPAVRLIAMSGTVGNAEELAAWLDADLYRSYWRPVPLVTSVHPYKPTGQWQEDHHTRTRIVAELARSTVVEGGAVLVFCGSRKGVEDCAQDLARALRLAPVQADVSRPSLRAALAGGIGYHHAGLTPHERRLIESLFRQGSIRLLVATSTVAAGVNLPAREVIVRDLTLGIDEIGASALLQMAGRAGRPGLEIEGRCQVIAPEERVAQVRELLAGAPVVSRLAEDLATHLNAEVAIGTVGSRSALDAWYLHTLHGRTRGAPRRVEAATGWLGERGFVRSSGTAYEITDLGRTTSAQMLRVQTAYALETAARKWPDQPMTADRLEERLLREVCKRSAEWSDVLQRPDQSAMRQALLDYDSALEQWEPGRARLFGVAECVVAGVPLEGFDLEDQWSVRQQVRTDLPRLFRFIARRALDGDPPQPNLAIAAADLAMALEYAVTDRGAGPLLEAIRRRFPADDQRRRLVAARYAELRARGLTAWAEGREPEQIFLARRPPLSVTLDEDGSFLFAHVAALSGQTPLLYRLSGQKGVHRGRAAISQKGGAFMLSRHAAWPDARPFGEFVAVDQNPFLWRYARAEGQAQPRSHPQPTPPVHRKPDDGPPSPSTWRVLEEYVSGTPRALPLAEHLRAWRPATERAPTCPRCGGPMQVRRSSSGRFWGCMRYPECMGTQPIDPR